MRAMFGCSLFVCGFRMSLSILLYGELKLGPERLKVCAFEKIDCNSNTANITAMKKAFRMLSFILGVMTVRFYTIKIAEYSGRNRQRKPDLGKIRENSIQ